MPQTNILIVGDAFVPARAARIPAALRDRLTPDRVQAVVCTGNLTSQHVLDYLKGLTPDVVFARAPLDEPAGPEVARTEQNGVRIAAVSGFQTIPEFDPD